MRPQAGVTCTPSIPAPARKRRRPNQDLQERLARCEQLLKQYAGGAVPNPGEVQAATSAFSSPTSASASKADLFDASPTATDHIERHPTGKMVQQDGNSRFMDSQLWTKFYDEVGVQPMELNQPSGMANFLLAPSNAKHH